MPVIINIAANLLFGTGLVLAVRRSPALKESLLSWSFFVLLAFQALLVTPVVTYLFRFYPQWSMLYAFDPQIFPELDRFIGLLSFVVVVVVILAALGGYLLARLSILMRQPWLFAAPIGIAALVLLYVIVVHGKRVAFIGDYDEFWQGNAVLFLKSTAGWVGLLLYGAGGTLLWLVNRRFADHDPSLL